MLLLFWRNPVLLEGDTEGAAEAEVYFGRIRRYVGDAGGRSQALAHPLGVQRLFAVEVHGVALTSGRYGLIRPFAVEIDGLGDTESRLARTRTFAVEVAGQAETADAVTYRTSRFVGVADGVAETQIETAFRERWLFAEVEGSATTESLVGTILAFVVESFGQASDEAFFGLLRPFEAEADGFALTVGTRAPAPVQPIRISIRAASAADVLLETVEVT